MEIIKDNYGRLISLKRDDGYKEEYSYYENGNLKSVDTLYPDGKREHDNYAEHK